MSAPRLVTTKTQAKTAASRWTTAYVGTTNASHAAITRKLGALGPDPEPEEIDRIIGNDSWTDPGTCNGCGSRDRQPRVIVGDEPDYESCTATLCEKCAYVAVALFP